MEIQRNFDNKLLKRKELLVSLEAQKSPSMQEAQDSIATEQKAEKDLVVVKSIRNRFGTHNFEIEAFIYNDAKQKSRVELKPKAKKAPGAS